MKDILTNIYEKFKLNRNASIEVSFRALALSVSPARVRTQNYVYSFTRARENNNTQTYTQSMSPTHNCDGRSLHFIKGECQVPFWNLAIKICNLANVPKYECTFDTPDT